MRVFKILRAAERAALCEAGTVAERAGGFIRFPTAARRPETAIRPCHGKTGPILPACDAGAPGPHPRRAVSPGAGLFAHVFRALRPTGRTRHRAITDTATGRNVGRPENDKGTWECA